MKRLIAFSLTIDSFKDMVQKIRNVELSLGSVNYELTKEVGKNIWAKRSLYFSKDVKEGEKIKTAIDLLGQDMAFTQNTLMKLLHMLLLKMLK